MKRTTYFDELPMAVTVCDASGTILYMNQRSVSTFAADGGEELVGKSLLDCHPPAARQKISELLEKERANTYTIEKNGKHKLIHQTPWYEDGVCRGLIEFSFEIPQDISHFFRG
jgi:transcriptional regulator with PAS, ATPase and Fis domain